jgi:hypothetical protein
LTESAPRQINDPGRLKKKPALPFYGAMPHNNAMRTMTNPYLSRWLMPWLMLLTLCMGAFHWAKTAPLANLSLAADSSTAHARNALPLLENPDFGMKGASGASVVAKGGTGSSAANWTLGEGKSATKWAGQMERRGWTPNQIDAALASGQKFPASNNLNPANGATRYVHPETGRSVVTDNKTGQVIHVGGDGFKY